jgi:transposase
MVRERNPADLPAWITDTANSVLASFGKGIVTDRAAVAAAMTQPWSNGQGRTSTVGWISRRSP